MIFMLQIYQRSEDTGKPFKLKFTCTCTVMLIFFEPLNYLNSTC